MTVCFETIGTVMNNFEKYRASNLYDFVERRPLALKTETKLTILDIVLCEAFDSCLDKR